MNNASVSSKSDAAVSWIVAAGIAAMLAASPLAWWPADPYGLVKNVVVEGAAFALTAVWLCAAIARGDLRYRRSSVTLPLMVFFAWGLASLAAAPFRGYAGPRVRELASYLLIYLLALNCLRGERRRQVVLTAALAGLFASIAVALAQYVRFIPTRWEASPWGGALGNRVYGLMLNPNILAGQIIALFPLGGAMLLFSWRGRARFWMGVFLALSFACLLLTVSWGGYAGFAAGMMYFAFACARAARRKMLAPGKGPLALVLACACMAALFFSVRGKSTVADTSGMEARFLIWRSAAGAIGERPLLGHGPGNTPIALGERLSREVMKKYRRDPGHAPWRGSYRIRFLDGDYFGEAVEFGIAGLGLLAWLFVSLFLETGRVLRGGERTLSLCAALGLGGCAAALLVQSAVSYPLRIPPTAGVFFVLLGFVARDGSGEPGRLKFLEAFPRLRASLAVIAALVFSILTALSFATLRGELLLVRAFQFASRGLWPRAAALAGEAVRYPVTDPEAYNIRGDATLGIGRPDEAARAFRSLLLYDPSRPDAWRKLGTISEMSGNGDAALRFYARAVALERHDTPTLRVYLARLLERSGRRDEAVRVLREGITLYPKEPALRAELARISAAP